MGATAPCKGCDKRYLKCHSDCVDYKKWRENIEKAKEAKSKNQEFCASRDARTTHVPFICKRR